MLFVSIFGAVLINLVFLHCICGKSHREWGWNCDFLLLFLVSSMRCAKSVFMKNILIIIISLIYWVKDKGELAFPQLPLKHACLKGTLTGHNVSLLYVHGRSRLQTFSVFEGQP